MKVNAPGKLILSGEHAVVYGKPALAMAVNRYVTATATSQRLPFVSFDLSDLSYERGLTLTALKRLKSRIKQKYQRFITGDFKIREVLQKPVELAQFAFTLFFETLNLTLKQGVRLHIHSDIPVGCGMGSSAATIVSIIHAIAHHLEVEVPFELFYRLGLEAENMQHGYSSGLDLRVSMQGGSILMDNGKLFQRPLTTLPLFLVNSGMPDTITGECVTSAAKYFKNSLLADDFAAVTQHLDEAFQNNQLSAVIDGVKQNHRLLTTIQVVPERVQQFISAVEKRMGAAKICGAGSVSGTKAGVILILTEDENALKELCELYHYSILPIRGEDRGVHVV